MQQQEQSSSALSDASNIKGLGEKVPFPQCYDASLLEAFDNRWPGTWSVVNLNCEEFTSLCPKTGQPDFAEIYIEYVPANLLVESKSLKLYLGSFRNEGVFHEDVVNRIFQDLWFLLRPHYLKVVGNFKARGGIAIVPVKEAYSERGIQARDKWLLGLCEVE
jgi:7-cyano-7-deazaguanine reductase